MANIDIEGILKEQPSDGRLPKTKIVCTLGPASRSVPMLEKLLRAGMNVARFNFSHGTHEYHQETLDNLNIAMQNTQILCAVMLDTKASGKEKGNWSRSSGALESLWEETSVTTTKKAYEFSYDARVEDASLLKCTIEDLNCFKGPEIRTGFLKDGKPIKLTEGQEISVTTDYSIKGDENTISMSYKKLPVDLKPGNTILCADGTITLTVLSCDPSAGAVRCRCENTAMLGERKNVNLPGIVVDLPTLTDKDKEDILDWGVPNKIDMIALSFVRKGSDLVTVRQVLGSHAKQIKLMSKVENQEGVINFDEILRETDSFMVARGDLGMEIPVEKIFLAQKMMIYKCNLAGKPVVTATQMLESMIKSPRPTRAEATDVANAVLDGTDCVMLSGESAAGAYPELAVKIMARICIEAESSLDYDAIFKHMINSAPLPMTPLESLASSAVRTANKAKAALIVVLTRGGTTAKLVAKYRPAVPILSVVVPTLTTDSFDWSVSDETPARHSLTYRGLIPLLAEGSAKATETESTDMILEAALKSAVDRKLCKPGDAVVALHRIGIASVIKICIVK
ncbi:Pyruvate kinase, cytosolic isozyme [Dendrobium catenatum]|uniref:Pyruvate kinase n=1 Tax=Dendrobium catenatum TaxID=906689 RepID=A0A2I0VRJ7_9ASPA|nr:Pyruvate kinase, cytosolic isozyme [Dendrobium catenatum]